MNTKKILQGILFIAIIGAFIYIGTRDFNTKLVVDNERFDQEYPMVNSDNVFKYASAHAVYSYLRNGSAVIFMGFPASPWSGHYASILNDVAKECGLTEILYYDFYEDRQNKNGTYQSIVLSLSNYLPVLDENNQNIYAPTLVIVKNGQIIAYDNETAIMNGNISPKEYWNEYNTALKRETLTTMFQEYLK